MSVRPNCAAAKNDCKPIGEGVSPFDEPSETTDVALVVEDRTLYVNKGLLAVYSPVFQCMFNSEGFKEKDAEEIPLPDKTCAAVVHFLYQLYPVHSLQPVTDQNLPQILPLADEYQVEHVRQKCEEYIRQQLTKTYNLTADQALLYLSLCERHNIPKHHDALVKLAEQIPEVSLLQSAYYLHVPPGLMKGILLKKNTTTTFHSSIFWNDRQAVTRKRQIEDLQRSVQSKDETIRMFETERANLAVTLRRQIEDLQRSVESKDETIRMFETERANLNVPKKYALGWFFYVMLTVLVAIIFHSFISVSVSL